MSRQRRIRVAWVGAIAVPLLVLASYGVATAAGRGNAAKPAPGGGSSSSGNPNGSSNCGPIPALNPQSFPASPNVTSSFNPLVPGMQTFLDGVVIDKSGVKHPHRITDTITDLTKVVDGVHTILIDEQDTQNNQLQESELWFGAQDNSGQVWLFGEYPEEYSNGQVTGAPASWLSSVAGAHAGIIMLANPQTGTPTYRQGIAPAVGFEDCATVFQTGQHACVTAGCYDNVLVTDEFAPNDPKGGHQRKFYAPGIGTIQVGAAGGVDPETLQLTKTGKLCAAALSQIRQQAQAQDQRAYTVAKNVWAGSPPAAQTLTAQLSC
jgi:hypothetical protein